MAALNQLFGPAGKDVVLSDEPAQDRQRAEDFAAKAREKNSVSVDPKNRSRAFLLVGTDDWPFPDSDREARHEVVVRHRAGRRELLYRRIGSNELDAIALCRGYVDAQHEYALQKREGYDVTPVRTAHHQHTGHTGRPGVAES